MKKIVAAVALVLTLGVAGNHFANAGMGRGAMMGYGPGPGNGPQTLANDPARQTFMDQTVELRQKMYDKRTAYFALMNTNPMTEEVKAQARELWQDIFDLQTQLKAMADELGVKNFGPGMGCDPGSAGGGPACANGGNGPRNCGGGCQQGAGR